MCIIYYTRVKLFLTNGAVLSQPLDLAYTIRTHNMHHVAGKTHMTSH